MPTYGTTTPTYTSASYSLTFKDAGGDKGRVSISGDGVALTTVEQREAVRDAIADATNAGLLSETFSVQAGIRESSVVAFDEAQSAVTTKAVLIFQDEALNTMRVEIPAPDASIFQFDGKTVNPGNALVSAIRTAVEAALNATTPAGTYTYVRGIRGGRSRKQTRANIVPTIAEPSGGAMPPDAPGT